MENQNQNNDNQPHEIKLDELKVANETSASGALSGAPSDTVVSAPSATSENELSELTVNMENPSEIPTAETPPIGLVNPIQPIIKDEIQTGLPKMESEVLPAAEPPAPGKKYLIAGIIGLAVISLGYIAYSYFFSSDATDAIEIETTNSLSTEDISEIFDELESIYAPEKLETFDEPVLEEIPPGLELNTDEEIINEPDLDTSTETEIDEKVKR